MPPAPRAPRISYGPRRVPMPRPISGGDSATTLTRFHPFASPYGDAAAAIRGQTRPDRVRECGASHHRARHGHCWPIGRTGPGGEPMRRASVAIVLVVLGSGSAWAQEESDAHRTAVSVVGGFSVGSTRELGGSPFGFHDSGSGFAVGGGIAHDLSPRLTVEADGLYLDRGSSAWSADAGLRLNLSPSHESLVPYFAVSGG